MLLAFHFQLATKIVTEGFKLNNFLKLANNGYLPKLD